MKNLRQSLVYFLFISLFASPLWAQDFSPQIMAPLLVKDMAAFNADLQKARAIGIKAVSVDVWWGIVEKNGDNQFDWTYYDTLFATIKANDLKIMPIMSFHKCGGNVNAQVYRKTLGIDHPQRQRHEVSQRTRQRLSRLSRLVA